MIQSEYSVQPQLTLVGTERVKAATNSENIKNTESLDNDVTTSCFPERNEIYFGINEV